VAEQVTDDAREQPPRPIESADPAPIAGDPMATGRSPRAALRLDGLEHAPDGDRAAAPDRRETVFNVSNVTVSYAGVPAVRDISFDVYKNDITALIGPSGCGKSTLIRCLNRMNDLVPTATVEGSVYYHGQDLYANGVDPVEVRKLIGMVFQKPNPFPKSIFDNIAFGPRVIGMKGNMDEIVERALRRAALWDETKDRLKDNAYGMSGGQQQRLCIARCLAVEPDVVLMDEPCSALDPISTGRIEDLMLELKQSYSIVIVTHNMQQAARVSDKTAFFTVDLDEGEKHRTGRVVEFDDTEKIFTNPSDPRTEAYVTGKVG
jgi:phosphate transport system ATP-binding protein